MNRSIADMLDPIPIPPMARVRQRFDAAHIPDVPQKLREELSADWVRESLSGCRKVGVTVGSRGIANLKEAVRELCGFLRAAGIVPYLIPSMGSHGGATAEGQTRVLEELGVTADYTGAEVLASMEVEHLGDTADMGLPVYYDKAALGLDGVILLNRVKLHTDLNGDVESGLQKIIAIGLGNHKGAQVVHAEGLNLAVPRLKSVADYALKHGNILFGIALVENAYDETCHVEAIPRDKIQSREPELLDLSRKNIPHFLFNDIDVLVVDRIGKNISGDGMDPNVIGRSMIGQKNKEIRINQIVTLGLTKETGTSGLGVGLSDVTTERIFRAVELDVMYVNAITAIALRGAHIPVVMDNDKHAIQLAIKGACVEAGRPLRMVRIRDTLSLGEILVSPGIEQELRGRSDLVLLQPPQDMRFDAAGNLL